MLCGMGKQEILDVPWSPSTLERGDFPCFGVPGFFSVPSPRLLGSSTEAFTAPDFWERKKNQLSQ